MFVVYIRDIRALPRLLMLSLCMGLSLNACKKSNVPKSKDPTETIIKEVVKEVPVPVKEVVYVSSTTTDLSSTNVCEEYENAFNYLGAQHVIEFDLEEKRNEGFIKFRDRFQSDFLNTFNFSEQDQKKIIQSQNWKEKYSVYSCDGVKNILDEISKFHIDILKIETPREIKIAKNAVLQEGFRQLINISLNQLDYFSGIRYNSNPKNVTIGRSFNIPLFDRPDYRWRTQKEYLVVDPSYDGALADTLKPWTKIKSIHAPVIDSFNDTDNKQGTLDINTDSFAKISQVLNYGISPAEKTINVTYYPIVDKVNHTVNEEGPTTKEFSSNSYDIERTDFIRYHDVFLDESNTALYFKVLEINEKSKDFIQHNLLSRIKNEKYKALIIDLRNNTGGRLDYALKIASLFLPLGSPLLLEEGRNFNTDTKNIEPYMKLHKHDYVDFASISPSEFKPTIIITNTNTISAGEIISAILPSQKLPVLRIGTPTFGKALAQKNMPFIDGMSVAITQSKLFSFSLDINKVDWFTWQLDSETKQRGLQPDIIVKDPVMEYLQRQENKGEEFSMEELKDKNKIVLEFSKPSEKPSFDLNQIVDPQYQFDPISKEKIINDAKSIVGNIKACDPETIPGHPDFAEENDCQYLASIKIMKYWVDLEAQNQN